MFAFTNPFRNKFSTQWNTNKAIAVGRKVTFLFFEGVQSVALRCGHCEKMTRMSKNYTEVQLFFEGVQSVALRCGHCEKMTRMSTDYTEMQLFFEGVRAGAMRCGHCEKMTRMSKDCTWLPAFIKQPGYIGQKGMANAEPYEFVELFLHESFWELLTVETNRYMALNKVLCKAQEKQLQALDDVTMPEIKKFLLYILQWALCLSATRTASSASNKPMFTPSALAVGTRQWMHVRR